MIDADRTTPITVSDEPVPDGLTDTDLGVLSDPDLIRLSVGLPAYDELLISFLPDDLTEFQGNLEKLKTRMQSKPVLMAKFRDYHDFFAAIMGVKEAEKISNDGVALLVMSQLALEQIGKPLPSETEHDPETGEVLEASDAD